MGMGFSFHRVKNLDYWFNPSTQERKSRVRWVNAWLFLCWIIFTIRRETQTQMDKVGVRGIYVNSILMAITYIVPLALMPMCVFKKPAEPAASVPRTDSQGAVNKKKTLKTVDSDPEEDYFPKELNLKSPF